MIIKNETVGTMSTPTEIKRVDLSWFEKCDDSANEYAYLEELLQIDRDLMQCDNILSEVNLQTGYKSHADKIYETAEKRQHLQNFIKALPEYVETHLDEPLYQGFRKANEALKQIRLKDFKAENTLGLRITPLNQEKYGRHREERQQNQGLRFTTAGKGDYGQQSVKEWLTLEDFIGNIVGDLNLENPIPGTNSECVEEFAVIFSGQYEDMLRRGEVDAKLGKADYLDQFSVLGEEVYPPTLGQRVASNLLDLTIVKPVIESCCGYNLITDEKLTEFECGLNVVFAVVDLITLGTGISAFAKAAETVGVKEAASYMGKQFMVELSADASAAGVAAIGEDREWPSWLTLALSLTTGITVGQIGNNIAFNTAGTGRPEDVSDEVLETAGKPGSGNYSSLRNLMTPEEVARYDKYWNNVADDMLKSNLSNYRSSVLSGNILKTTGGKINSKVLTAAIDTNTGDIYYGISGINNNPTRTLTNPQMQEILNGVNASMMNYPLENCGEFNAINNALNNGVNIQNLRVYSIDRVSGNYKAPCINCQNLYGDIVHFTE